MNASEKMSARTFICRQNHDNSVSYRYTSTQNVGDASIENSKIKVEKYLEVANPSNIILYIIPWKIPQLTETSPLTIY